MEQISTENIGIAYASFMGQYLHLANVVLSETIAQGNSWMIVSSGGIDWDEYAKRTKWSDFKVIIPILFLIYHGIELSIKALLSINNKHLVTHKLSFLHSKMLEITDIPEEIRLLVSKYIDINTMPKLVSALLSDNNLDIDDYYDFFKYPTSTEYSKINNYAAAKYQEKKTIEDFNEIKKDILVLAGNVHRYVNGKIPNTYSGISKA